MDFSGVPPVLYGLIARLIDSSMVNVRGVPHHIQIHKELGRDGKFADLELNFIYFFFEVSQN